MKSFFAQILTCIANVVLKRLRNGNSPNFSREEYRNVYFSFSQFGEDLAVTRWAGMLGIREGIYVDVGALDPVVCSNTLLLHRRGWRGVNVDMDPARIEKFREVRPNDYNVAAAVSEQTDKDTILKFPIGQTDRLASTAGPELGSFAGEKPFATQIIQTETLTSILEHCPFPIQRIDFLNIDVEGHDLRVLKGLNFQRYRPTILLIEAFTEEIENEIHTFIEALGYSMRERLHRSLLFVSDDVEPDFDRV